MAGKNVLDFDLPLRTEIKHKLADHGLAVISIGSPIGKVKLSEPWQAHFDRFKIAVESAEFFEADRRTVLPGPFRERRRRARRTEEDH